MLIFTWIIYIVGVITLFILGIIFIFSIIFFIKVRKSRKDWELIMKNADIVQNLHKPLTDKEKEDLKTKGKAGTVITINSNSGEITEKDINE